MKVYNAPSTTKEIPDGGCQSFRSWESITRSLIKSGEVYLRQGEVIDAISITKDGIFVRYALDNAKKK